MLHAVRVAAVCCALLVGGKIAAAADWSYNSSDPVNGPAGWQRQFADCSGLSQSPIAFHKKHIVENAPLPELTFINYDSELTDFEVFNNGHTLQVNLPKTSDLRLMQGGLGNTYYLRQFHVHWGTSDRHGSEHSLGSTDFPLELHFVHFDVEQKLIAALGVWFSIAADDNPHLQPFIDAAGRLAYKGLHTILSHPKLRISSLLPKNKKSFLRYNGSLTTPPCSETVTWTMLTHRNYVSRKQMLVLRHMLYSSPLQHRHKHVIGANDRPKQPLNDRKVLLRGRFTDIPCASASLPVPAWPSVRYLGVLWLLVARHPIG